MEADGEAPAERGFAVVYVGETTVLDVSGFVDGEMGMREGTYYSSQ